MICDRCQYKATGGGGNFGMRTVVCMNMHDDVTYDDDCEGFYEKEKDDPDPPLAAKIVNDK